jgi:hypothetical protein
MPSPFAARCLSTLETTLDGYGNSLTPNMQDGLRQLFRQVERILDGQAAAQFFLSSLDPGVGKTLAIATLLRDLVQSADSPDASVLVCLSTRREIQDLVTAAGLPANDIAIFTAPPELNIPSNPLPQAARVLFTTHQMVISKCKGGNFAQVADFQYDGDPRKLRIWDESMLPAEAISLDTDQINTILGPIRSVDGNLATTLEGICISTRGMAGGSVYQMPGFASRLSNAQSGNASLSPAGADIARTLKQLSGKSIMIRKERRGGRQRRGSKPGQATVLVAAGDQLPPDLAPAIILDASGRIKDTYKLWQNVRGGLIRLPGATRDYSNLTANIWHRGGGKEACYGKTGYPAMIDALAETIKSEPSSKWLVVHSKKESIGKDLPQDLQQSLTGSCASVDYLTWGMHRGTNSVRHCDRVILVGLNYYPDSQYEALFYAASGRTPGLGISAQELATLKLSEVLHGVFQATCRGAVRNSTRSGNRCHVYVMANNASGVRDAIGTAFPGCQTAEWRKPLRPIHNHRVRDALDYILGEIGQSPNTPVQFSAVQRAIGMKSSQFTQHIRTDPGFRAALDSKGIEETGKSKMRSFARRKVQVKPHAIPGLIGFLTRLAA